MTQSMTAFARTDQRTPLGEYVWEIRSVNHRYLEAQVRLPEELRALEPKVRDCLNIRLGRGKVECALRFKPSASSQSSLQVNADMASSLMAASEILVGRLGIALQAPKVMDLLNWPGVIEQQKPDYTPVMTEALSFLKECLDQLTEARQREGERLADLIQQRRTRLENEVAQVRTLAPQILASLREQLQQRLAEAQIELDAGRLEQEMLLMAQRLDVAEELDRLNTHLSEVAAVLQRREPIGRRLDFLMQELNREANTLGSKSNDAALTQHAVEMKVLIEQMREQVQNIE